VPNGTPMTKWEAEKRFRGWIVRELQIAMRWFREVQN
jgi:hypothetical protein